MRLPDATIARNQFMRLCQLEDQSHRGFLHVGERNEKRLLRALVLAYFKRVTEQGTEASNEQSD